MVEQIEIDVVGQDVDCCIELVVFGGEEFGGDYDGFCMLDCEFDVGFLGCVLLGFRMVGWNFVEQVVGFVDDGYFGIEDGVQYVQ